MKTMYEAKATAVGGRNGKVTTEDGLLSFETRMPKELGGEGGEFTNPEQLFATTYATCFGGALDLVISQAGVESGETAVSAIVGIGKTKDGLGITAIIEAKIPGVEKAKAMELLKKAHTVCPYSKAISGNVDVELKLVD
ncbi:MAG: organic hydroperoxide resistance protein [Bacteroidales bacterium]|jgi:osmotically inducible protein OsmC|nr:organic hydroperoxide resistance protein [Bacteroidales bacterium]